MEEKEMLSNNKVGDMDTIAAATTAPDNVQTAVDTKDHNHEVHVDMADLKMDMLENKMDIQIENIGFKVKVPSKQPNESRFKLFQKTPMEDKEILRGVSGTFKAGRLTAVMGASGAGKTSLLNVLAGEHTTGTVSGTIKINGVAINGGHEMKELSGFVFQDDVILSTMTVREAITMSARLRLPQTITAEEKKKKVDDLLAMLRLTKAAETIIGSSQVKGISGGERKRCALAMEMVTNPSILFLDEPTSGLDTFTAFNVCDILRSLARTGRTVVATIHQPSSETFHLFDDLCLLAEGKIMYFGPVKDVVDYFAGLGYPCPKYSNPADYLFMSVLNTEKSTEKPVEGKGDVSDKERIRNLLEHWSQSERAQAMMKEVAAVSTSGIQKPMAKYHSDFMTQFIFLFMRAFRNLMRNRFVVRVRMIQVIVLGLIVGLVYRDIRSQDPSAQFQGLAGAMFFYASNSVMATALGVLHVFGEEKPVFIREYSNGFYSLAAYYFSKVLVEFPFQLVSPLLLVLVSYWLIGLNPIWYCFFYFLIGVILLSLCGTSLGIFFASLFSQLQVALAVVPMVLLPLMLFAGLFVNNGSIPPYFDWIKYLSPIKWGFELLIKTEFFEYQNSQFTGDQALELLSLNDGLSIPILILILACFYIGLVLLGYLALLRTIYSQRK